jgi:hypothetical protein
VEDGVGRELMQLHVIDEVEPTMKFMGGKRKATIDEGKEKYPEAIVRARDDLVAGNHHFRGLREQPSFLELVQIDISEARSGLALSPHLPHRSLRH